MKTRLEKAVAFRDTLGFGLAEPAETGVRRVSVGGSLAHAALGAFLGAAKEIRDAGSFAYADAAVGMREINGLFAARLSSPSVEGSRA